MCVSSTDDIMSSILFFIVGSFMAVDHGVTYPRVVELLKDAVAKKGQREVSRASGVQLVSVQRYLKGLGVPTTPTLQKLADYFKVPVWELRGIKGITDIDLNEDKSSEREAYYNLVSATKNLLNTVLSEWPGVDDTNRKATLELARSIIVDIDGHDEKYLELAEVATEVVRRSVASRKKIS